MPVYHELQSNYKKIQKFKEIDEFEMTPFRRKQLILFGFLYHLSALSFKLDYAT